MRRALVSLTLLLFALVSVFSCYSVLEIGGFGGRGTEVGGWTEIEEVKDNKEVQKLGKFSVEEYNRNLRIGGGEIVFSEVVAAKKQMVAGIKYYLKIAAVEEDEGGTTFDAIVVVKPWVRSKELVTFAPSTQ